jgi:transmembrane sensor
MSNEGCIRLNEQISEEAAEWFIEFRSGDIDADGRLAFDTWVRASPEHLRAFIEMAELWKEAGSVDAQRNLDVESLIARSRAESNIVVLTPSSSLVGATTPSDFGEGLLSNARPPSSPSLEPPHARHLRQLRRLCTAAAVLVVFVGVALVTWSLFHGQPAYITDVGEQRSIRLDDGSTVILNSRSKLRVEFTEAQRTVELLQGQALFHVAKNHARPFIVRSNGTSVRAVGTQFDVNMRRGGTIVTVVEGRVAVIASPADPQAGSAVTSLPSEAYATRNAAGNIAPREATPSTPDTPSSEEAPILLSAGEQLKVVTGATSKRTHTNVSSATAWTQGQVVLESASLAEVADEFNRYSSRKLIAEDHGASPLHLSGVFATDPDFLVRYLRSRSDIVVRENATEVEIIRNDPK